MLCFFRRRDCTDQCSAYRGGDPFCILLNTLERFTDLMEVGVRVGVATLGFVRSHTPNSYSLDASADNVDVT